ncbi:septum formation family protein [Pseudonocardia nantongensis]|uniref:septum formation family protein n=1 Tax=Pseudonocardia nantongensis TaxID=1181885 RepID=UPI00397CD95B
MDPSSPTGDAPPTRRHAAPAPGQGGPPETPGQPGEQVYDGYDGRYSRRGPAGSSGSTSVLARPADAEAPTRASASPVAPTRRRRAAEPEPDTTLVSPDHTPAAPGGGRSGGLLGARRVGIGILLGAFVMLAVASMDSLLGAEVPVLGSFASSGGAATADAPPPMPPPPDTAGTCLNWSRADATDTAAVDCAQPHLFEQAGRVALADQPVFPADATWQKLVSERCTPLVDRYLNGRYDPDGKFRVGALKPSQQRWDEGDRGMRCGLQTASRSGAMFPMTGKVAQQDQSAVQPVGTCLAIDGRTVGDPTRCGTPHAVETVGVVDLGTEFPEEFPSVEDQDKFLQPACTDVANSYAGNDKVIADKGLTVYWNNLSDESWQAGSRKVNCNVGTLLPDGSGFASITGSLKGRLTVADQAAPPAPTAPGVPSGAPGTPAAPSESAEGSPAPVQQPESGQPAAPDPADPSRPEAPPSLDVPSGLPGLSPP